MSAEYFKTWALILLWFIPILWITASIIIWSLRVGISPMPTSSKAKATLIKALPSLPRGKIFELGSGWGTLIFPLASHYPGCQVIGIEASPVPYFISQLRRLFNPFSNIKIKRCNFYRASLNDADLIICYLFPEAMGHLKKKFHKELKPGTWVISNTFAIPGWKAESIHEVDDLYHSKIYVYRVPQYTTAPEFDNKYTPA